MVPPAGMREKAGKGWRRLQATAQAKTKRPFTRRFV